MERLELVGFISVAHSNSKQLIPGIVDFLLLCVQYDHWENKGTLVGIAWWTVAYYVCSTLKRHGG